MFMRLYSKLRTLIIFFPLHHRIKAYFVATLGDDFYLIIVIRSVYQDWDRQDPTQIVTEMCGFVTILSGTFLLHKTKDMGDGMRMHANLMNY